MKVNLVAWDNHSGLSQDLDVLSGILAAQGHVVHVNGLPKEHRNSSALKFRKAVALAGRHLGTLVSPAGKYDVNLFLEAIRPLYLPLARANCLVPNPEWFREEDHGYLPHMDWILCKTKQAQRIFTGLGCRTQFIGFTSMDCYDSQTDKHWASFLHIVGKTMMKGTQALVRVWLRHPEWPILTIIQSPQNLLGELVEPIRGQNIRHVIRYLPVQELRQYQNSMGVHLCPSEAEGFGHVIVEAMSCGALVMTNDSPPMNELVTSDRGILVPCERTEKLRLGTRCVINPSELEQQIEQIIQMDELARSALGTQARRWYEANVAQFQWRLSAVLDQIVGKSSPG